MKAYSGIIFKHGDDYYVDYGLIDVKYDLFEFSPIESILNKIKDQAGVDYPRNHMKHLGDYKYKDTTKTVYVSEGFGPLIDVDGNYLLNVAQLGSKDLMELFDPKIVRDLFRLEGDLFQ